MMLGRRFMHASASRSDVAATLSCVNRGEVKPDYSICARLVQQCSCPEEARLVHRFLVEQRLEHDSFLRRKLVELYVKVECLDEAGRLFKKYPSQNVITWTFMVTAHARRGECNKALQFFQEMQLEGVKPDKVTFASLLQTCGSQDLPRVTCIHAWIEEAELGSDVIVRNALVSTYGRCGGFWEACAVFDSMVKRDVVSWNAIVLVYGHHGKAQEALVLFQRMLLDGMRPDRVTYLNLLRSGSSSLSSVGSIHGRLTESGCDCNDVVLMTALLDAYSRCGSLESAHAVFQGLQRRDFICINAMIAVYGRHGRCDKALELFRDIANQSPRLLDKVCFLNILGAMSNDNGDLNHGLLLTEGRILHDLLKKAGLNKDLVVGTALMNMYGSCGDLQEARKVFDQIDNKDSVAWNAMITAYARHEEHAQVVKLFQETKHRSDPVTLSAAFHACACLGDITLGRSVYERMVLEHGGDVDVFWEDPIVGNALLNMYGRCGDLEAASSIFDRMLIRDACTWNAMVMALMHCGRVEEAVSMSKTMLLEAVRMDGISFTTFLNACSTNAKFLKEGQLIHRLIVESGLAGDAILKTTLLTMYAKFGQLQEASMVFEQLLEAQRDLVAWNAMGSAYVQQEGCSDMALVHFRMMQLEGIKPDKITFVNVLAALSQDRPGNQLSELHEYTRECGLDTDVVVGTALLSTYGCQDLVNDAETVFSGIEGKDSITWNAMISVYNEHHEYRKGLDLYWKMDVPRDRLSFVLALNACANLSAISEGRMAHKHMVESGEDDANHRTLTALVNMYSKCGQLEEAQVLFDRIPQAEVVSWNTMVSGYAQAGHAERSLRLFWKMQQDGVKPDVISFVSVLGACSHAGLVEQGCTHFASLIRDHEVDPVKEHYACMVDLLGRAGRLEEAEKFVRTYAIHQEENPLVWTALLGACGIHQDLNRGSRVGRRVLDIDPAKASWYIALANLQQRVG